MVSHRHRSQTETRVVRLHTFSPAKPYARPGCGEENVERVLDVSDDLPHLCAAERGTWSLRGVR